MKSVCAGESLQPSQAHFVAVCLLLLSLSALFTSSLLSLSPALSLALFLSVALPYHHPATFPAKYLLLLWTHGDNGYVLLCNFTGSLICTSVCGNVAM